MSPPQFQVFCAVMLIALQSQSVVASPLPVNEMAIMEGKDWASTFSLRPVNEQRASSSSIRHDNEAVHPGAKDQNLSFVGSEPDDKALWGSELSLGLGHTPNASQGSQSVADRHRDLLLDPSRQTSYQAQSTSRSMRAHTLQEVPMHSMLRAGLLTSREQPWQEVEPVSALHRSELPHATHGKRRSGNVAAITADMDKVQGAPTSSHSADTGSGFDVGAHPNKAYYFPAERRKAISEGVIKWQARLKWQQTPANQGKEVPSDLLTKHAVFREKEKERKGRTHDIATRVLDEMLEGYDSQNEKRTSYNTRGAINRKIMSHGIEHTSFGRIWQTMRTEFMRRYPERRVPEFLRSKLDKSHITKLVSASARKHESLKVGEILPAGLKKGQSLAVEHRDRRRRPLGHGTGASSKSKKAKVDHTEVTIDEKMSIRDSRRSGELTRRKVGEGMLVKFASRFNEAANGNDTLSQEELHRAIREHEDHPRSVGHVKTYMRDKWIRMNPGKKLPKALLPLPQRRISREQAKV